MSTKERENYNWKRKAKNIEINENAEMSKNHPQYSYRTDYKMLFCLK